MIELRAPDWKDYELIDCGNFEKLERFGPYTLIRPEPQAIWDPAMSEAEWKSMAHARYVAKTSTSGDWEKYKPIKTPWQISFNASKLSLTFQLKFTAFKHVGVFPEQAANWVYLYDFLKKVPVSQPRVLNLFAYTGGSTLAALAAGAAVVHIDAARSVVNRARQSAAASGLGDEPARWIVEDVLKFCRREVKRGNRYDAIILDPPTYGHGPKGEEWIIKRDLLPLLELCGELTERRPRFVLLTCHSPGIGPAELSAYLSEGIFGACGQPPRTGELFLETAEGRRLPSGVFARWPS